MCPEGTSLARGVFDASDPGCRTLFLVPSYSLDVEDVSTR